MGDELFEIVEYEVNIRARYLNLLERAIALHGMYKSALVGFLFNF
jgi:hypothetical protein